MHAYENAWVRASLQVIPYIGGALDILIFDKANKIKDERVKNFLISLNKFYGQLEKEKIDMDYLQSEGFLELFEKTLSQISLRSDVEMRDAFTNGIVNLSLTDFEGADKSLLSSILSSLPSAKYLRLLSLCQQIQIETKLGHIRTTELKKRLGGTNTPSFSEYTRVINELEFLSSFGLIEKMYDVDVDVSNVTYEGDTDASGSLTCMYRVSSVGKDLLSYISAPTK